MESKIATAIALRYPPVGLYYVVRFWSALPGKVW